MSGLPGQHHLREVVGAGQKSGHYRVFDARSGNLIWSVAPGPGGRSGGILWGTATDGERIYLAEANSEHTIYQLADGRKVTSGLFAALDPATGAILWQTPDPSANIDIGAVSTANGVLYAGSMSGHMYALDGANGRILWDYPGQGSSNSGPAIVNGTVYWGNGYTRTNPGKPSTTFYAFAPVS